MDIIALVKLVPDSDVTDFDENGYPVLDDVKLIPDSSGVCALEFAMRLKEVFGGNVTTLTVSSAIVDEGMRICTGMGADRAVALSDPAFRNSDTFSTVEIVSRFIEGEGYDLIVCGTRSDDSGTGHVPAELSVMLGTGFVNYVRDFTTDGDDLIFEQDYGDSVRTVRMGQKCVIAVSCPIDPTIPSIGHGPDSEIVSKDRISLNIGAFSAGANGSMIKVTTTSIPLSTKNGESDTVEGDPDAGADEIFKEVSS